jgi:hypothetical protein
MFLQEHITSIVIKNTSSRNLFIFLTPLLWLNLLYTTFFLCFPHSIIYQKLVKKKGEKKKVGVLIT